MQNKSYKIAIAGTVIPDPDRESMLYRVTDMVEKPDPKDALLEQAKRFDCGSVDGFVEATNYFYEKMDDNYMKIALI